MILFVCFRMSQVSRDWYRLSRHPPLLKQRRRYVKLLREEYRLSKENYPPPNSRDSGTPQQVLSRHMTGGQSPLNVIQPKSGSRSHSHRTSRAHSAIVTSPSGQTPCPAYLLENVKKLSLDDGTAEVRRCLFPMADLSPTTRSLKNVASRATWNQRSHTNYHKCCTKSELMAGKKTNRSRLRRL